MKNIVIIIFFAIISAPVANAQGFIEDFFKSQSRDRKENDSIKSRREKDSIPFISPDGRDGKYRNNVIIDERVIDRVSLERIFVLRQDYCLYTKKKKQAYGYEGQDFFGSSFTFAVKCKGYNIILDPAVYPWKYDDKYPSYEDRSLTPDISMSYFKMACDSINNGYVTMDSIIRADQEIRTGLAHVAAPFSETQDGFTVNTTDTCSSGVVVWIYNKGGDIEEGLQTIRLKAVPFGTEMYGTINIDKPKGLANILGALYLTPTYNKEDPYALTGIVTQNGDSWQLSFPFKGYKRNSSKSLSQSSGKTGKLTLIKKK